MHNFSKKLVGSTQIKQMADGIALSVQAINCHLMCFEWTHTQFPLKNYEPFDLPSESDCV